jgi:hypothetical protein
MCGSTSGRAITPSAEWLAARVIERESDCLRITKSGWRCYDAAKTASPRWDLYTEESPTRFAIFSEKSTWIEIIFWFVDLVPVIRFYIVILLKNPLGVLRQAQDERRET